MVGKKIIIELTNRCNLACGHCFSSRHGGKADLPLPVLAQILTAAKCHGFTELSFTGGDPTVYRHFAAALELTSAAGYRFAINTNGWNFTQVYPLLVQHCPALINITFSLDGATAATHDRLRGTGSWRRVMQAMSICVVKELPFALNMVITTQNQHEVPMMVNLAAQLGSCGVRFGHLLATPATAAQVLDLSFPARRAIEQTIFAIAQQTPLPVVMAPGYFTHDLFPCAPLNLQEININCAGEMTTCCHLSGYGDNPTRLDVMGDLARIGFDAAYARLQAENALYRRQKVSQAASDAWCETDFFPCLYCARHYGKVEGREPLWLNENPGA